MQDKTIYKLGSQNCTMFMNNIRTWIWP